MTERLSYERLAELELDAESCAPALSGDVLALIAEVRAARGAAEDRASHPLMLLAPDGVIRLVTEVERLRVIVRSEGYDEDVVTGGWA